MRHDLLFETDRFNLSEVHPHFINPCCFGEDVGAWLRARLIERGARVDEPGQEDWGWYLGVEHGGRTYFLGIGGNVGEAGADRNRGEWRVMIQPHRSVWERVRTRGRAAPGDDMLALVRDILAGEPAFTNVRSDPPTS
jgi:hypothetical protein